MTTVGLRTTGSTGYFEGTGSSKQVVLSLMNPTQSASTDSWFFRIGLLPEKPDPIFQERESLSVTDWTHPLLSRFISQQENDG